MGDDKAKSDSTFLHSDPHYKKLKIKYIYNPSVEQEEDKYASELGGNKDGEQESDGRK
jgi:hypothetical protein